MEPCSQHTGPGSMRCHVDCEQRVSDILNNFNNIRLAALAVKKRMMMMESALVSWFMGYLAYKQEQHHLKDFVSS